MKELEEYKSFAYFYEGMPTDEDVVNQVTNQQKVLVTIESHTMNVEFQNKVEAHSNSKISVHERNVELHNR